MRFRVSLIGSLAVSIILSTTLSAATWFRYYDNGKQAIRKGRWKEAIEYLSKALAEKPKGERRTLGEGNFPTEYYPHYYLGIAYLESGRLKEAKENFDKAESSGLYERDLTRHLQKLTAVPASSTASSPTVVADATKSQPPPRSDATPARPPEPSKTDPNFERLIREAESSEGSRRFDEAVGRYDEASRIEPDEFRKRNLQERRAEAARHLTEARSLANEAQGHLSNGNLAEAKKKFEEADRHLSGQKAVTDGLGEIRRREQEYVRLKNLASQDFTAGRMAQARTSYLEAKQLHPEAFRVEGLETRLNAIDERLGAKTLLDSGVAAYNAGRYTEAESFLSRFLERQPSNLEASGYLRKAQSRIDLQNAQKLYTRAQYQRAEDLFRSAISKDPGNKEASDLLAKSRRYSDLLSRGQRSEAKALDAMRFAKEGQTDTAVSPAPLEEPTIRQGLQALFSGRVKESIAILENVQTGGSTKDANLHAYLGAAYAMAALLQSDVKEGQRLRQKAVEQFRRALVLRKDYQLSERLFSPHIVDIFKQVRATGVRI